MSIVEAEIKLVQLVSNAVNATVAIGPSNGALTTMAGVLFNRRTISLLSFPNLRVPISAAAAVPTDVECRDVARGIMQEYGDGGWDITNSPDLSRHRWVAGGWVTIPIADSEFGFSFVVTRSDNVWHGDDATVGAGTARNLTIRYAIVVQTPDP